MKKIVRQSEPEFWKSYKNKHKHQSYKSADEDVKCQLHKYLLNEQQGICAYCCKQISYSDSHNEHIMPQVKYPKLTMEYDNIVISCTTKGTGQSCGMCKERDYCENLFVSPLEEDCDSHFRYAEDGRIIGADEKGEYTINLLNLNAEALRNGRKSLFDEMVKSSNLGSEYIKQYYLLPHDGQLPRFVDMVSYFYNKKYFE